MAKVQAALMAGGSAIALMFCANDATAQTAPPASASAPETVGTIIVTARKRSENILKIPVAVSALTASDLAVRGIESLDDVAKATPGLTDDQSTGIGARADRSFQELIIRGMNPSSNTNPTTSVFINGTPVASADFLQNLDDVERVEVLKGPQSAYFGRETFAGAVNVVAKSATNDLGVDISAKMGTRNTIKLSGVINLPIIDDKLAVRFGYTYDSHDGSYKNAANPNQTLGDQQTKSFHVAITARPIENLTIKAFGMLFHDNDGPAATGALIASPGSSFNQGNCTVAGQPFFCGTLPGLISASPAQNTTISPTVNYANLSRVFLANPGGILGRSDLVNGFGLKRNAYHGDINVEYGLPALGVTLTYLGSYNHNNWSEISDLSLVDGSPGGQYPGYPGFAYEVQEVNHDQSHEFRIATDAARRFRALVGASYIDAYSNSGLGVTQYGPGTVLPSGATTSKTTGIFFSFAYDLLPQVTIDFDGRYQWDKEGAYDATGAKIASGTTRDFLPRASIQYKITPDTMTYFTFSKGVNPGTFNTQFSSLPAPSQAELIKLGIAGGVVVKPEDLTNYELGVKGRFFGGRATLSADIYYDKWTNQLNANTYYFQPTDPANPYNVPGQPQYIAGNVSSDPYAYTDNSARSTAKGVEADATFIVFDHVTVNLAGAINDTKYDSFNCTDCAPYPTTGFNAQGKYLPHAPKDSFTGGVEYTNKVQMFGAADWFARADYIYKDGAYIQSSNTVKTQPINLVNLRGGLKWKNVSVEGWVDNVFNNKSYVSGFELVNFAANFVPTVVGVGLPQLITGGVTLRFHY